jgi:uncharacterized protein RhaS with RHS repeats
MNQDPIGLEGGFNVYQFAPNAQDWIDPSGNIAFVPILIAMGVGALTGAATDAGMQVASNVINGKDWNDIDYGSVALGAGIGAIAGTVLGKVGKLAIGKCRNAFGPFRKWYRRKPSYSDFSMWCIRRTTRGWRLYRSSLFGYRFGRSGSSGFVGGFRRFR